VKHCAVLDVGHTHIKVCIVDNHGALLHSVETSNRVLGADHSPELPDHSLDPSPDPQPYSYGSAHAYPHYDVDGCWGWFLHQLTQLSQQYSISSLVTTAHGAAAALIQRDGALAFPILDYEFPQVASETPEYWALRPPFRETFSPDLPAGLNLGRQLYWQQKQYPDVFTSVDQILTYPQYWSHRLCGIAATEVTSLGAHTDLWSPSRQDYSSLVDKQQWRTRFAPLTPAWQRLGPVKPELLRQIRLDADCEVLCGIHDSNAAYLRYMAGGHEDCTVVSTGTWVICMAGGTDIGDVEILSDSRDQLANVDLLGRPLATARFMGGREWAVITQGERGAPSFTDLEIVLSKGILALPAFSSQGGPFRQNPGYLTQQLESLNQRSALASLYCALITDHCLTGIQSRGDIFVDGAFVQDEIYLRVLASLRSQQTLYASTETNGTALGAALLVNWPERRPGNGNTPTRIQPESGSGTALSDYVDLWRETLG